MLRLIGIRTRCARCRMVRDGQRAWNQMEDYIRQHSEAEVTHGICPDWAEAFRKQGGLPTWGLRCGPAAAG